MLVYSKNHQSLKRYFIKSTNENNLHSRNVLKATVPQICLLSLSVHRGAAAEEEQYVSTIKLCKGFKIKAWNENKNKKIWIIRPL